MEAAAQYRVMEPILLALEKKIAISRVAALKEPMPPRLFHYTTSMGLKGILDSGRLWATHFRFLNDASEIDYGISIVNSCIDELRQLYKDDITTILLDRISNYRSGKFLDGMYECYIACFCTEDDLLNQWRDYANGGGYALGFQTKFIGLNRTEPVKAEQNYVLHKVVYDPETQRRLVREVFDLTIEALVIATQDVSFEIANVYIAQCVGFVWRALADYLLAFKHPAFKVEQEWRLCHISDETDHVQFREGQFGLTPYVLLDPCAHIPIFQGRLPIDRVTHAPTKDAENVRFALQLLLQTKGYRFVDIAGSVLPIRNR